MPTHMTKAKLLEFIRAEREGLEETLQLLSPAHMTQASVQDQWSVKDILAHIVTWEQRMIHFLQEASAGHQPVMLPSGLTWADLAQINERTYLENKDKTLADVLADFHRSYRQVLDVLETLSEEDLMNPHRFAWRNGDPLGKLVAANTYRHYEEHKKSILLWRKQ